jgi:hypothetical protein
VLFRFYLAFLNKKLYQVDNVRVEINIVVAEDIEKKIKKVNNTHFKHTIRFIRIILKLAQNIRILTVEADIVYEE